MPNYCECFLCINTDDPENDKLSDVMEFIQSETKNHNGERYPLSFDKIIPYPEPYKLADRAAEEYEDANPGKLAPRDGFNNGGYYWCKENWGTKWNAIEPAIERRSKWAVVIKFETAWNPPWPVINALAERYPQYEYTLEYYERGMAYCGSAVWENGSMIRKTQGEYYGFRGG